MQQLETLLAEYKSTIDELTRDLDSGKDGRKQKDEAAEAERQRMQEGLSFSYDSLFFLSLTTYQL